MHLQDKFRNKNHTLSDQDVGGISNNGDVREVVPVFISYVAITKYHGLGDLELYRFILSQRLQRENLCLASLLASGGC